MNKVYVRLDGNKIVEVNSDEFIHDLSGWVQIDEGEGDKYHHAQNHYFPLPIKDFDNGKYRYGWDGAKVIELDIRPTLEESKETKKKEISQAFDSHVKGSFICSLGYPMQFGESDGVKMEGSIKLLVANGGTAGYLTDANDETHYDVPLADIQAVHLEMLAKYAEAHAKKQILRQQAKDATTQAELDAIEW